MFTAGSAKFAQDFAHQPVILRSLSYVFIFIPLGKAEYLINTEQYLLLHLQFHEAKPLGRKNWSICGWSPEDLNHILVAFPNRGRLFLGGLPRKALRYRCRFDAFRRSPFSPTVSSLSLLMGGRTKTTPLGDVVSRASWHSPTCRR